MQKNVTWKGISADTTETCLLSYLDDVIIVRSEISGWIDKQPITAEYYIKLDTAWRVMEFDVIAQKGSKPQRRYAMFATADGKWRDNLATPYRDFDGCRFIDITLTPFTNSLPINGLKQNINETRVIDVLYIDIIEDRLSRHTQTYTRLDYNNYRFENDNGNFTADIAVNDDGLVTHYPGLFEII